MSKVPVTPEASEPADNTMYENLGQTTKQPRNSGKKATPTDEQANTLVSRVDKARLKAQSEYVQQAIDIADAVSDQVMDMATPLIGLSIAEKSHSAISKGGKMAAAFLRSTVTTGMQIENVLEATLQDSQDPLYQALLLTGA